MPCEFCSHLLQVPSAVTCVHHPSIISIVPRRSNLLSFPSIVLTSISSPSIISSRGTANRRDARGRPCHCIEPTETLQQQGGDRHHSENNEEQIDDVDSDATASSTERRDADEVHKLIAAAKRERSPSEKARLYGEAIERSSREMEKVFALVASGTFEMKRGRLKDAEELLQEAAALSSTQPAPFNALGKLAELRGDTAAAKKFFKEALDRNPQHAPSLHSLGVLLSRQRLFAQAEAYFRRASEASPHDPKIWQAWALMEWRCRGRYGEAKELFERGIEKCPPHAPLYVAFASCEASRRGRTKARALLRQIRFPVEHHSTVDDINFLAISGIQTYTQALTIDPNEPRAYVLLAQLEGRGNNPNAAIDVCQAGLKKCPGNVHLLCTLGQIYSTSGDSKSAILVWKSALRHDPWCAIAAHELGLDAQRNGRFDEADEFFRRGMKSKTDRSGALRCGSALAELQVFLGNAHAARATMTTMASSRNVRPKSGRKEGSSGSSADGRFLRTWAMLEKRLGDLAEASKLFREATLVSPSNERTWLQYGLLERRRGELSLAIRCFKAGLRVSPLNPHLWMMLGTTLWENKQFEESRHVYQEALKKCPNNQPLILDYALKELQSGDTERALEIFRKANGLSPPHHEPLLIAWLQTARDLKLDDEAKEIEHRLSVASSERSGL